MGQPLRKITIRGFKSIELLDSFEPGPLSVLIGANGAGKSNFVDFFRMLRAMADESLQKFANDQGGGDGLFFLGPRYTRKIQARLEFGDSVYQFDLEPTAGGGLQIGEERVQYTGGQGLGRLVAIGRGNPESRLNLNNAVSAWSDFGPSVSTYVYDSVANWTVYHFHDTSMFAPMRRDQSVQDADRLRADASNIAAVLLRWQKRHDNTYTLVRDTVRLIAPFFDDFLLRPEEKGGEEKVRLEWRQKGSDYPFQPVHLSDGSIRFICLAAALMQPILPATMVIDEPELGLHPFAIGVVADLIKSAATRTQVVISTQSPILLDHFAPEEIVVVNRRDGRSILERLAANNLADWLAEYSVGELWQKNVVRGGPSHE